MNIILMFSIVIQVTEFKLDDTSFVFGLDF